MYQPRFPPPGTDPYLAGELQSIAQAQSDPVDTVQWNVLHKAPKKPREGMVAFADGTDWNPGSGAGPYKYLSGAWSAIGGGGSGSGTVTSASVVSANGFAGTVATATTTPAITLTTSITGVLKGNGTAISAAAAGTDYVTPGGALGTPASGTLTNCTGLPVGGISGLGTGVATALAVNVGTAGAPVVNGGALGTPSSGVATNLTGTAAGLTAGTVTTNANLTGDVTSVGNATTIVKAKRIVADVTLGVAGTSLASGSFSAFRYLEVQVSLPGYAGSDTASLQFNATAGTGYRYRWLTCAAAATTFTAGLTAASTDRIKIAAANTTLTRKVVAHINNDSTVTEKLVKFESQFGTGSAATQDTIDLGQGAWVSGASTSITAISLISTSNMNAGTQLVVFGWN